MTFVVTENCIKCKYTDCVAVCPVDAFFEHVMVNSDNPDEKRNRYRLLSRLRQLFTQLADLALLATTE